MIPIFPSTQSCGQNVKWTIEPTTNGSPQLKRQEHRKDSFATPKCRCKRRREFIAPVAIAGQPIDISKEYLLLVFGGARIVETGGMLKQ